MSFLGRESVERALARAERFGKVGAATLTLTDGAGTQVAYAKVYVAPVAEQSALGAGGTPTQSATVYAFQRGEASAPRADDVWTVGGVSYLVLGVTTRCNADAGYAVHDCRCVRAA